MPTHSLLAVVDNIGGNSDDVDGDLLARDTDHTGQVVQAEEGTGLLGLVTGVLQGQAGGQHSDQDLGAGSVRLTVTAQHEGVPLEHDPLDEAGAAAAATEATANRAKTVENCILKCLGFSGRAKECGGEC